MFTNSVVATAVAVLFYVDVLGSLEEGGACTSTCLVTWSFIKRLKTHSNHRSNCKCHLFEACFRVEYTGSLVVASLSAAISWSQSSLCCVCVFQSIFPLVKNTIDYTQSVTPVSQLFQLERHVDQLLALQIEVVKLFYERLIVSIACSCYTFSVQLPLTPSWLCHKTTLSVIYEAAEQWRVFSFLIGWRRCTWFQFRKM